MRRGVKTTRIAPAERHDLEVAIVRMVCSLKGAVGFTPHWRVDASCVLPSAVRRFTRTR